MSLSPGFTLYKVNGSLTTGKGTEHSTRVNVSPELPVIWFMLFFFCVYLERLWTSLKALTREAHAAGICEDHFKQMLTEDTPALFDHFKTMIQECTFSGFPSVELIRACWDKKRLECGWYLRPADSRYRSRSRSRCFWLCEGTVRVKEWAVVHAYVAYGSNLKFEVAPERNPDPRHLRRLSGPNQQQVRKVCNRLPVGTPRPGIQRQHTNQAQEMEATRECRLRYQVADGEVRDMQTMGFHLMESPIFSPGEAFLRREDYPERDGVKIYPYTVDKAFEYTVKLLYFGELKTMNEAIRSLWDSFSSILPLMAT